MAIEIYAISPNEVKLVAVAPIEKRDEIETRIHALNNEAIAADVLRRFRYSISDVEIWI